MQATKVARERECEMAEITGLWRLIPQWDEGEEDGDEYAFDLHEEINGPCDDGFPHRIVAGRDYDWCKECLLVWR